MTYPLASSTWNHEEIDAMHSVIATGNFTMGRNVAAFEAEFARYVGSDHCVMVNSGSSANLLMIAALRYRKVNPLPFPVRGMGTTRSASGRRKRHNTCIFISADN